MKIIKKYQEGNPIEGQDAWEERERKRLQQLRNEPGLTPIYPEFDLLLGARGLINGAVKEGIKQVPRAAKYIYNAAKKLPYSKTAHNFMTGMISGLTVDNLNKQLFGKSWGESVSEPVGYVVRKAGWNPDDTQWGRMLANIGTTAAEFTNPGYLLSPASVDKLYKLPTKTFGKLQSSNASGVLTEINPGEYGWGRLDMAQNWQPSKYNPSQQQILLGSKKAASRVIRDAAYLERLEKYTGNRELAKKIQQAQLDAMDYTTLGNDLSANAVDNGVYALFSGTRPQPDNLTVVFGTPGYRKLMNTPDYLVMARRQIPSNISFSSYYFERYPGEHWFKRGTHEVLHSGKMTPMFEDIEKYNANLANKVRRRVMYNYELSPWEIEVPENSAFVGPEVINYLTRPDELRVRAHKVFRINQTTGKPWVDILNDPKYIKDPDIKQLKDLYDKAGFDDGSNAVIDFLNGYLKKGGKLNNK